MIKEKSIIIGHIDSGVNKSLANFQGAIRAYRHFDYYGKYNPSINLEDSNGHGTMTASIMLGRANKDWVGGVAPDAEMLVAVAIESGHRISRILSALMWMIEEPIHIVNMSIGFSGWNPVFRPLIQKLVKKGVLVIASIGNGGAGQYHSPGAYPEVLSVGAATIDGTVLSFSGSKNNNLICQKPDLLGLSNVPSITIDGNVHFGNTGTSGATAYVSGMVAKLMSKFPSASAFKVSAALKKTSMSLTTAQEHRSLSGLIQEEKATELLKDNFKFEEPKLESLCFFRDEVLEQRMKYANLQTLISVVLFIDPILESNDLDCNKLALINSIRSICSYENYGYYYVNATKKQLQEWWDAKHILMISSANF